jgi:hypothetical protein
VEEGEELPSGGVQLHGFLRLLCELAFQRANPNYDPLTPYVLPPMPPPPPGEAAPTGPLPGTVDASVRPQPLVQLPEALRSVLAELQEKVLPSILTLPWIRERTTLSRDRSVQLVLALARPSLAPIWSAVSSRGTLEVPKLQALLRAKGVLAEVPKALPSIPLEAVQRTCERCMAPDVDGPSRMGYEAFEEGIFRLGELRYGGVDHMSARDRTAALCQNLMGVLDTATALTAEGGASRRFVASRGSAERMGAEATRMPYESAADLGLWGRCWAVVDLSKVSDFPACQAPVHEALHRAFHQLRAIHAAYETRVGMTEAAWRSFLVDIELDGAKGVSSLFRRLVALPKAGAAAAAATLAGEVGPMSLPRFLESLVWLAILCIRADGIAISGPLLGRRLNSLLQETVLKHARTDPSTAPIYQLLGDQTVRAKVSARVDAVKRLVGSRPSGSGVTRQ